MNFPGLSDAPGFDDPLGVLRACHGRIEAQCVTLERLLAHLPVHGCDTQARQAAQAVLRYFDTAGHHHHQDEEQDLFPMLVATGDPQAAALVAHLLAEHRVLDAAWSALRAGLQAVADGTAGQLDDVLLRRLVAAYRAHIAQENSALLPSAARLLSPPRLERLGQAMASRRGLSRN